METHAIAAVVVGILALNAIPAAADGRADALIAKAQATAHQAKTLQADVVVSFGSGGKSQGMKGSVRVMRPNLGSIRLTGGGQQGDMTLISDGKTLYAVTEAQKQYTTMPAPANGITPGGSDDADPLTAFLQPENIGKGVRTAYAGPRTVNGVQMEAVRFTSADGKRSGAYFFAANGLLEGTRTTEKMVTGTAMTTEISLKNVRLDAPIKADEFAYTPPADYKKAETGGGDYAAKLIAEGKDAPAFDVPGAAGGRVTLSESLKGKKAGIVSFWFYG